MAQGVGTLGLVDARAALDAARRRSRARRAVRAPRGAGRTAGPLRGAGRARCTPRSRRRLAARGIDALYAHQAAGDRRAAATAAASSSRPAPRRASRSATRCRSSRRSSTATATPRCSSFPTKALAQDQLRSLRSWLVPGLRAVTYDGDTASDDRTWARKNANVVLTNPEMLHMGILPAHKRWATFLMRLRYVVVDELHTLRGIFGSHVAHVLRRLRRVCEHYGASPTFCFASATIGNPGELAAALCGLPVEQIDDDASPHAERVLACWQRPLLDAHSGARAFGQRRDRRADDAGSCAPGTRRSRSRAAAAAPRSSRSTRAAASPTSRPSSSTASRRTAPGISPRNGARSSSTSRAAGCSASRRPTRSSSASTSAVSTR